MADPESFTLVDTRSSHPEIYSSYQDLHSAHSFDIDTSIRSFLREQYPGLTQTVTFANNVPLLQFAWAGNAISTLDIETESIERFRYFFLGNARRGIADQLVEARTFAKYHYQWAGEDFILYVVQYGYSTFQYILKVIDPMQP